MNLVNRDHVEPGIAVKHRIGTDLAGRDVRRIRLGVAQRLQKVRLANAGLAKEPNAVEARPGATQTIDEFLVRPDDEALEGARLVQGKRQDQLLAHASSRRSRMPDAARRLQTTT